MTLKRYYGNEPQNPYYIENRYQYTASNGQTIFAAIYKPGYVDVYVNGSVLVDGVDFTAQTGTSISMAVGLSANDEVKIVGKYPTEIVDCYTKTQVDGLVGKYRGTTAGTGSAITITTSPTFAALTDGTEIRAYISQSNTVVSPTLAANGLTAKTITKLGGTELDIAELQGEVIFRFNSGLDKWELVSVTIPNGKKTVTGASLTPDFTKYEAYDWTTSSNITINFPSVVPTAGVMYIDITVDTNGRTLTLGSGYNLLSGYAFDGSASKVNRVWLVIRNVTTIDVYIEQLN